MSGADALVITCTDARLHWPAKPHLTGFLQGKYVGIRAYELLAVPGGCLGFASSDEPLKSLLLAEAKRAASRGITRMLLVNHSDCHAYGGASAFSDSPEEFRKHAEDLRAARTLLREAIPNVEIRAFYATVEDRPDGPFVTFDEVR